MDRGLIEQVRADLLASPDADSDHLIDTAVTRRWPLLAAADRDPIARDVRSALHGLGPLDRYLADSAVDEVMVNSNGTVWIERHGALAHVGVISTDDREAIIERLLAPNGLRIDRTRPIADARLADGSRVCVVIPPVAIDGPTIVVRRFRTRAVGVDAFGDPSVVALCEQAVERRLNVLVSGATSSGKTTLLNALCSSIDDERIVTIEDTAELRLNTAHVVRLESRHASSDGIGEVTLRDLLKAALRLRPDRLIIGEVRGDEAVELLQALNTGHDGSFGTIHANSPTDALRRLETLVVRAVPAWPLAAVRAQIQSAVDVVIQTERGDNGARRIADISELVDDPSGPAASSGTAGLLERNQLGVGENGIRLRPIWARSTGPVAEFIRGRS